MGENYVKKVCDCLEKLTLFICGILCLEMVIIGLAHILWRYVFRNSLTWSEEVLRFSLVWFAILSATIIHKQRGHLGIVIIREKMPEAVQRFIQRIIPFITLLTMLIVTIYGITLLFRVKTQVSPACRIPMTVPYASIPTGFLLMAVYSIAHIFEDIVNSNNN